MVRALPEASACLISVVCFRVNVIFFFSPPPPCALRSDSRRRDLSSSLKASVSACFRTPAALSCSSSNCGGTRSSVANWDTVLLAIDTYPLLFRIGKPMRPRCHDQRLSALVVDACHFRELVDGQLSQI